MSDNVSGQEMDVNTESQIQRKKAIPGAVIYFAS